MVECIPATARSGGGRPPGRPPRTARASTSGGMTQRYPLPSNATWEGWDDPALARALLVDCFGREGYDRRADLHRALAADVLAALPRMGWTLTSGALIEWAVRSHGTLILWRRPLLLERLGDGRPTARASSDLAPGPGNGEHEEPREARVGTIPIQLRPR